MAAALIYQHATRQADQKIADHLGLRPAEVMPSDEDEYGDDGASGALVRAG